MKNVIKFSALCLFVFLGLGLSAQSDKKAETKQCKPAECAKVADAAKCNPELCNKLVKEGKCSPAEAAQCMKKMASNDNGNCQPVKQVSQTTKVASAEVSRTDKKECKPGCQSKEAKMASAKSKEGVDAFVKECKPAKKTEEK